MRSASKSKREVAFRFFACIGIALALYYTPELRWSSGASDAVMVQADSMLAASMPKPSREACVPRDQLGFPVDAMMEAN